MGRCDYCGTVFPKTRKTRKYCTNRCKTNACLEKKPRLRAADVEALRAALQALADRHEALRTVLREEGGERRLVAYVVPAGEEACEARSLRAHLARRLPDYMVPGLWVELERGGRPHAVVQRIGAALGDGQQPGHWPAGDGAHLAHHRGG